MPSDKDIERVRFFISNTVDTYTLVVGSRARITPADGKLLLDQAIREFGKQTKHLEDAYAKLDNTAARDAGVVGDQLRAKVEMAAKAAEDVERKKDATVLPTKAVRRWIKRVKILAGSLKSLIPGAEALVELLDLLDAALDR